MNGDGPAPRIGQPLFDAILDEQKSRWDRGERPLVEDLLARHPTLGEDAEATLDVIYQEFVIRRALGESPSPEAYLRRFPDWADALVHQFAVDAALRPVNEVTVQPTDPGATGLGPLSTPDGIMPPAPLRSIDGYDILGELGRGGMGIVFKALDRRLNRVVAIKMVSETTFTAPAQLRRFLAEAEVIARLSHPNIIPVYAVGEEQGRPYFSLELAEGGNLSERLAKGPITSRQAAELVETLAHAVSAAHAAGVIHRDLKPSNVLLGHDGVPKISDFGLAKLLGDDSARTLSGEVLGTPSYMAPEQAEGRSLDVGPAADIYALGAILFQALTGRPPFLGASAIETMKLVVSTEAVAPRRLRPDVPRDLETIAMKCLEKDPRGRYTDAAALAADLRRFLDGRPIAARPVGPLGRLWRWCRRNPWAAAFLLALGLGAIGSAWQAVRATGAERAAKLAEAATRKEWDRAQTERGRAQAERDRAEAERNRAEKSRDRAISAVQVLVGTVTPEMRSEQSRPYRQAVIAAGLRESTALVRELEGDPRAEFQRVHAYMALAHLEFERGEHAAAVELVRKAIPLAESLVARDPTSVLFRSELGNALHYLAANLPDGESCRSAARRSNQIFQALVASHPEGNRRGWLQSIALNHYNVGNYACSSGRQTEGIEELLAARTACETALRLGDCGAEVFDLNARILMYLCRAFRGANRFDDSTAAGRQAIELLRLLVHDHPDDIGNALQLTLAHDELGQQYVAREKWAEAIECYQDARKTLQGLAARNGTAVSPMATIQTTLARVDYNLREAYDSDPVRYAGPRRALDHEAYEICDKLTLFGPLDWNLRIVYALECFELANYQEEEGGTADLDLVLRSEQSWAYIHRGSPAYDSARIWLVIVRRKLALELAARGRSDEASRWRRLSLTTARGDAGLLFEIALIYAKRIGPIGVLPNKLDRDQLQARRRRFAADAIAMLREAVADGFKDGKRLRGEPGLASIRALPEFQAIKSDLEFPAKPFARP